MEAADRQSNIMEVRVMSGEGKDLFDAVKQVRDLFVEISELLKTADCPSSKSLGQLIV